MSTVGQKGAPSPDFSTGKIEQEHKFATTSAPTPPSLKKLFATVVSKKATSEGSFLQQKTITKGPISNEKTGEMPLSSGSARTVQEMSHRCQASGIHFELTQSLHLEHMLEQFDHTLDNSCFTISSENNFLSFEQFFAQNSVEKMGSFSFIHPTENRMEVCVRQTDLHTLSQALSQQET